MTPEIKPLVAGNWKMNGLTGDLSQLADMAVGFNSTLQAKIDLLICTPATLIFQASEMSDPSKMAIGAQDCHFDASGAHTGDISAAMIADAGATSVIVGHSERRTDHGETNDTVRAKAVAGLGQGLQTIICIGETEAGRKSGATLDVLKYQMDGSIPDDWAGAEVVVAYEPVWAIGTGLTPTESDIEEAHNFMRSELAERFGDAGNKVRLLYGGSVKPANAASLMAIRNVDGALVGGASLKAQDFMGIAEAYLTIS